jgi:hypothetical protein
VRRVLLGSVLICLCVFAGCFEWTEDSSGNLQSVGLPGVPVWQSKQPPPPLNPSSFGFTPDEASKMSGPVLVMPSATGTGYHYRFYQTGHNHCAEDLKKMLDDPARSDASAPAPYCTSSPTAPPVSQKGSLLVF